MDILWAELTAGFPNRELFTVIVIRFVASTIFGAAIGIERQRAGKAAGLRTHVLVATGTTVFILSCIAAGMHTDSDGISRVIQGIVTGIGFVGAGSIIKRDSERDIQGVTTSAGIWMTAAIGVATGLGRLGIALMATVVALIVLRVAVWVEGRHARNRTSDST